MHKYISKAYVVIMYNILGSCMTTYYLHDIVFADSAFALRWMIPFTP